MGLRGRKRSKRGQPSREPLAVVMVLSEGEQTEPNYLRGWRRARRIAKERLRIIAGQDADGNDPLSLVKAAKQQKREFKSDNGFELAAVWCLFDRDQHDTFDAAVDMAQSNDLGLAISNPSFELWFLLHYQPQTAHIERQQLLQALRQHLPAYEKNREDMYDELRERLATARANSLAARRHHHQAGVAPRSNPSTNVDELLGALEALFQ